MPVAGAVIGIVASVAAGAMSAVQARQASKAQENAARYNEEVSKNQAGVAAAQSRYDQERIRERNRRILASQRARYAKSGITLTGTALDVARDSEAQGELDVLARRYRGQVDQTNALGRGGLFAMEARQARSGRAMATAAPIIGGIAQGASIGASTNWPSFQNG